MNLQDASILLVDDEEDLLEIFELWLRSGKCTRIETARDGQEALDLLHGSTYDLLILDLNMPRIDGISLLRRLKAMRRSTVAIMFISGSHLADTREVHDLGVREFLAKPIRRKELLAAAQAALIDTRERWLMPLRVTPRQTIDASAASPLVSGDRVLPVLGRGGFTIPWPKPLSLGAVSFRYPLAGRNHDLVGHGFVRWRSSAEQLVGIEFAYLEPESRAWVLSELAAITLSSFIPGLAADISTSDLPA